jgi:hypothetical protein
MTSKKIAKNILIYFIVLIASVTVVLGGSIILRAGQPTAGTRAETDFDKRLKEAEAGLASNQITRAQYDSIYSVLQRQLKQVQALENEEGLSARIPAWASELGISEPQGMKFDPVFSSETSVSIPAEGFNSVTLIYSGSYSTAVAEAERLAASAGLQQAGDFTAKGSPTRPDHVPQSRELSFVNYKLDRTTPDYLISLQVEPSGRMIIMITDSRQLDEVLLAYEPLNSRHKNDSKRKKQ